MNMRATLVLILVGLSAAAPRADAASEAEVRALILKYTDSWTTGDVAAFTATIDDQFHFSNPGGTFDRKQTLEQFTASPKLYANIKFHHMNIVIQGDRFMAEYQYCSTDRSTGKREADGTVAVGEVRNGRILSWKEYYDPSVGDLQASGKLIIDEGEEAYPYPRAAPNRW